LKKRNVVDQDEGLEDLDESLEHDGLLKNK
jgi:hypothetical protein